LFLAVSYFKETVFVKLSDIACAKPSVFSKCFVRGFRLVVIAHHNTRPLRLDLAVRGDSDLDIAYRLSNCSETVIERIIRRYYWRSFRQTIALINSYSGACKNQINIIRERGPARDASA